MKHSLESLFHNIEYHLGYPASIPILGMDQVTHRGRAQADKSNEPKHRKGAEWKRHGRGSIQRKMRIRSAHTKHQENKIRKHTIKSYSIRLNVAIKTIFLFLLFHPAEHRPKCIDYIVGNHNLAMLYMSMLYQCVLCMP